MDYEIIGGNPNPTLEDLNKKAIQKLYELLDYLDSKSNPEMIKACVESLAKLNASIKGSNILDANETPEERKERLATEAIKDAMGV